MGSIYGLALLLVIFDGIITECVGGETSRKRKQNAPVNNLPFLPSEIIEVILSKTDYKTIKNAIREFLVPPNDIVMGRILQNSLMSICPDLDENIHEYQHEGDSVLRFGNNDALTSFFNKFGDKVKKMGVEVHAKRSDDPRINSVPDIIRKYAKNLEELQITCFNDEGFWEELSDGENEIIFPEVKKFQFWGRSIRSVFKLNVMLPKLESLKLIGNVADENCLANVKGLKEFILNTDSIHEQQLDGIFANNENMSKICLTRPNRTETMHSISKHLKKLKILEVHCPGKSFFLRTNNGPVYTIPSVSQLVIDCFGTDEVFGIGNLSFDMPHLKQLTFSAYKTDKRIFEFIAQFTELETLELSLGDHNAVECIEKLKHIIEFRTATYENRFQSLILFFETLDDETKLHTIKLLDPFETAFEKFEKGMKESNIQLKDSGKPTWTLSRGGQIGTDNRYLMFKRDPST